MKIMRSLGLSFLSVCLAFAVLPAPALSQQGQGPGRLELERRVRARFGEIVRERLGLSEAEERELGEILRSSQEEREALALRESQLRRRVAAEGVFTNQEGAPALTDEEARAILDEMQQIRAEEGRLAVSEQEQLLGVLTPSQLVRFYAVREAFNERVRGVRQGGPGRGPGIGRGGPPLGPGR